MKRINLLLCLIMVASMVVACGTPEPEVIEKEVTKVVTEKIVETVVIEGTPEVVEKVVTATPEPEMGPAVGGTFVYGLTIEMDTLDVHKSGRLFLVCQLFGASLLARDPETFELVPYLAESWTVSEDGMTYEFKLREDVVFHDGTPLTAHEYAFTFNRAIDPETKSPTAGQTLFGLASAEAVDDYTLRLNMFMPNSVLPNSMANNCYGQPIPQAAVEDLGDDFGRNPIGVGPFKFKEWVTGDKIILERNPDYTWGPEFTHGGPPFVETVEFRVIPEYATRLAGLEAGELDFVALEAKDVESIQGAGQWRINSRGVGGSGARLEMNTTHAPLDDVRVRQALSHAINRQVIVQVVELGQGVPILGPITPATIGYWPGVEYIGFPYDLGKAKALMEEAGYVYNDEGMLEKDGQPLTLNLTVDPQRVKGGEILKEQFEDLGVHVDLVQLEPGVFYETTSVNGDFDLAISSLGWPDYGMMFVLFHSSNIGGWNISKVSEIDDLAMAIVFAVGDEAIEEAATKLQRVATENVYGTGIYGATVNYAVSNRIQGPVHTPSGGWLYLYDAYIETAPVQ